MSEAPQSMPPGSPSAQSATGSGDAAAQKGILSPAPEPTEPPPLEIDIPAFEVCRRIVREAAKNFSHGLRLTPEPKRSALFAIYAWMRTADDLCDDQTAQPSPDSRLARLIELQRITHESILHNPDAGLALDHKDARDYWPAFISTVKHFRISPKDFDPVFDAMRQDIAADRRAMSTDPDQHLIPMFETWQELEKYCDGVATTVGSICMRIWDIDPSLTPVPTPERIYELARSRARAFQLTNIARDIAEDLERGRVYLPKELFDLFRLEPAQLKGWTEPRYCTALMNTLLDRAQREYNASAPLDRLIHKDGEAAMWAMTQIYQSLLGVIRENPALVADGCKITLSGRRKAMIAGRAILRNKLS